MELSNMELNHWVRVTATKVEGQVKAIDPDSGSVLVFLDEGSHLPARRWLKPEDLSPCWPNP